MSRPSILLAGLLGALIPATADAVVPAAPVDATVFIAGYGDIAYREPLPDNDGPAVVLVHGIYAGASSRAFTEVLPLLDEAGYRVFLVDLPGAGLSDKPRREYTLEIYDRFLARFLAEVVAEPATVVAESLSTVVAQRVAADRPELVEHLVLLSPTGVTGLAEPPTLFDILFFYKLYYNDWLGRALFNAVYSDLSLQFFLARAYFDDTLIDDQLLAESRLGKDDLEGRWLLFAFIAGQLYRSFADAAEGVEVPTLAIFGSEAEAPGPTGDPEDPAAFAALQPAYDYAIVPNAGQSVQREQPEAVAELIGAIVQ